MSKPAYILPNRNPESYQREILLNQKEALTILVLFLYDDETKMAEALEEVWGATRSRIQRLYDKCEIECMPEREHRCMQQLKKWALDNRLVAFEDGEYRLTTYYLNGAGRQLELEFI